MYSDKAVEVLRKFVNVIPELCESMLHDDVDDDGTVDCTSLPLVVALLLLLSFCNTAYGCTLIRVEALSVMMKEGGWG